MLSARIGFAVLFAGIVGLHGPAAEAVTVTGSYQGHVTRIDPQLAGQFALGDPFTVNFTYGTTGATDTAPGLPDFGDYQLVFAAFTGKIGSYNFTLGGSDRLDVVVGSGVFDSSLLLSSQVSGVPVASNDFPAEVDVVLYDHGHATIANDSLPTTFLPASLFAKKSILSFTVFDNGQAYSVDAAFNQPTTTPIPPSLLLFVSALGGVGVLGAWRRQTAHAAG